ncbi:hypothetical protein GUJ93_ZPchr0001g32882 [Zizania palustris]|uniref:Uncharacterized protein n=1 Tax=Zizania palustris TaxID=103762 RepID=A0A8J5RQ29_ZIZPA|nr:hypothetical protein GUJ93_ZPchr0001g32882 [Zizania palustris]
MPKTSRPENSMQMGVVDGEATGQGADHLAPAAAAHLDHPAAVSRSEDVVGAGLAVSRTADASNQGNFSSSAASPQIPMGLMAEKVRWADVVACFLRAGLGQSLMGFDF